MDFKSLNTFKLIAATGSFQRAAEELNYAQSTVTMQIKKLEEDLGVKLFDRGKKMTLTEAGQVLLEETMPLLFRVDSIRQKMISFEKGESGMIKMGSVEPAASLLLSSVIVPFLESRPQVQFELEVGNTVNLSQRVAKGELDFAIASTPTVDEHLLFTPLFDETLGLLLPATHPLVDKPSITMNDLHGERLVFPGQNQACRTIIETHLMKYDHSPYSNISIGSIETLKKMAQKNLGIAIVPVLSSDPDLEGTVLRRIDDMRLSYPIGFIQRKDQLSGTLLAAFQQSLQQELMRWKDPW
ncbi:LysR family transcriptional regulator [Priestia koreensis]|uniref:LysR family transcriptional regulator n=1 Tax=Priestia koreensis TaxID=284581 RepID=UPI001F5A95A8|nr:LysR family transcriptional regulator [Priestia koreensis]UNL83785.1 LysR family transcriptional regulator [Priestia koreensis]